VKIGLCEKDLRGSLRENLEWIAEHGFKGFQIWKPRILGEGLTAKDVLRMAEDLGLEISAVGGGPNLVDPKVADETVDLFRGFLDLAVELGPRIVTAETKAKPEELSEEDAWKYTTETISKICEHAEDVGAVLAIEPSGPCFIRDYDMWLELYRAVGSECLKVNYDPANIVWAGRDPVEGVRALGEHIVHTHAKDISFLGDVEHEELHDVPAGQGLVDYPAYLAALKEVGYDGYLTVEMHAGERDRREDILRAAANLRFMLSQL